MPSEKQLLETLDKDTVDTSRWTTNNSREAKRQMELAESKVSGLAIPQVDGTLRAWHVTDQPEKVIDLLKTKGDFYAREGDLCGGLYVSAVPHYWEGRSSRKWDFLRQLTLSDRKKLYQKISEKLLDERNSGYITESEFWNAFRHVENYQAQAPLVDIVVNQPYNIDVIRMVKDLDLAEPFQPHHIQVDFVGRYLEFNTQRAIEAYRKLLLLKHGGLEGLVRTDLCNMLKGYGWDGVYTKADMGTNPELVIWNGDRVIAFGDYATNSSPELSGKQPEAFWVSNPLERTRFEAQVAADQKTATIFDRDSGFRFMDMTLQDAKSLKALVVRMMLGERHVIVGRFEAAPIYNNLRITDRHSKTKQSFMAMSNDDMNDLGELMPALIAALRV